MSSLFIKNKLQNKFIYISGKSKTNKSATVLNKNRVEQVLLRSLWLQNLLPADDRMNRPSDF